MFNRAARFFKDLTGQVIGRSSAQEEDPACIPIRAALEQDTAHCVPEVTAELRRVLFHSRVPLSPDAMTLVQKLMVFGNNPEHREMAAVKLYDYDDVETIRAFGEVAKYEDDPFVILRAVAKLYRASFMEQDWLKRVTVEDCLSRAMEYERLDGIKLVRYLQEVCEISFDEQPSWFRRAVMTGVLLTPAQTASLLERFGPSGSRN